MARSTVPMCGAFTSFAEFDNKPGPDGKPLGNTWFAFTAERPLAFFAGIWAPQWISVWKVRDALVTTDLFAFLTTQPNDVVESIHMKAMPVILTTPDEVELWLTAPWEEAKKLQRHRRRRYSPDQALAEAPRRALSIIDLGSRQGTCRPPAAEAGH